MVAAAIPSEIGQRKQAYTLSHVLRLRLTDMSNFVLILSIRLSKAYHLKVWYSIDNLAAVHKA